MRLPDLAPRFPLLPLLPLCLVLILAGCSDDRIPLEPSQTRSAIGLADAVRPLSLEDAQGRVRPDLSNIWPNDDGRSWTYRIQQREWSESFIPRLYPTADQVPPVPSLTDIAGLLRRHPIGENPVLSSAGYRMQFNGIKTTLSGAVGQNLETTILEEAGPVATSRIVSAAAPAQLLHAISVARPDLAAKIAARWPSAFRTESVATPGAAAVAALAIQSPTFLSGYAWEKTNEYIGSYGDLNTDLAWKYLVADLKPGSSFSMQLVPDLASDIFLHARVLRDRASITDAGAFRRALSVLYVVDFGVSAGTDADGNVTGYFRVYSYGTVDYVPGVGPVASYERALVSPGLPLDPGMYDQTIRLAATTSGAALSAGN